MSVEWTASARKDVLSIFDHILQENSRAAEKIYHQIHKAVMQLVEHPGLGRPGRVEGTRELVISGIPYIIPYEVRSQTVFILRVMHGARQWPVHF